MRADKFFADKFSSRTKAKEALAAGRILRNGKALSPSDEVKETDSFTILEGDGFVSNGGKKLERGLCFFHADVEGKVIADLGASTGGFTDCLLKRGAKRVFCVDVGEDQLASELKGNARVTIMDRTNARYLERSSFSEPVDDVVSDLSFISLRLVLPAIAKILPEGGRAFLLFKPQFECGGVGLGKSGILPRSRHAPLLDAFYEFACGMDLAPQGIVNAPVVEGKNLEYILFLQKGARPIEKYKFFMQSNNIF